MAETGLMELADAASDHFRNSTDQDVRPKPFVLARTKSGQVAHLALPYTNPETKARMLHVTMIAFGFWEVVEYVIAFESWVVKRSFPTKDVDMEQLVQEIKPSQEPDRQDGVVFAGASHYGTICGFADVATYGNQIALGKTQWFDGGEGLVDGSMFKLLPPITLPPPPDRLKQAFYARFPDLDLSRRVWDNQGNSKEGA